MDVHIPITIIYVFAYALLLSWFIGTIFFVSLVLSGVWERGMWILATPIGGILVLFVEFVDTENHRKRKVKRFANKNSISFKEARLALYPKDWWLSPEK